MIYDSKPGISRIRPAGQIRPAKLFHSAGEDILSVKKKQYIYEKFVDLVECNISRNNNIT